MNLQFRAHLRHPAFDLELESIFGRVENAIKILDSV
jgi:hypothetical protein